MITIIESLYEISLTPCKYSLVLVVIFILMLFSNKRRRDGATGLYYLSFLFGLNLWLYSFLITYKTLGILWVIVGLIFAGVGIFPMALVGSATHSLWDIFAQGIYVGVIFFYMRYSALHFINE